jgi:hypothetical protein
MTQSQHPATILVLGPMKPMDNGGPEPSPRTRQLADLIRSIPTIGVGHAVSTVFNGDIQRPPFLIAVADSLRLTHPPRRPSCSRSSGAPRDP